jgi:hypothetical protein
MLIQYNMQKYLKKTISNEDYDFLSWLIRHSIDTIATISFNENATLWSLQAHWFQVWYRHFCRNCGKITIKICCVSCNHDGDLAVYASHSDGNLANCTQENTKFLNFLECCQNELGTTLFIRNIIVSLNFKRPISWFNFIVFLIPKNQVFIILTRKICICSF